MLSYVLSRSFCQAVAEVNRRSYPTLGSAFRAFTTSSPQCGGAPDSASVVTYSQLKTMLSNRDIQLFDVRNPDEYQAGRIPDAVNIPLDNLEESLKLSPVHFQQKFKVKAPRKDDDNIVFHCKSGYRSSKALDIACQLGFNRARHYKGGYSEWAEQEGK
ncbi:thiosulfate:glutathione sulfurtransferase isoform X1 [Micropterus salmoides]|uniref:thiosulfate:glutathione sulfurtransferase isoform X1 n=2 Tax=Micropterus TaxID=27705 RepID=UPI0018EC3B42|nr:thiosulfate:glutathione sulfurtransferase isoform X1 [Micropterus salmoides]XP_045924063.1 thiosulfate:glutathione sulfurtransferase isoform X1 [Micropterus dolomieu]